MMNQGITYNPQVASIAQQLVAQNQPIDSVINHVGPGASLAALVNAYKQAKDRARQEQIQGAKQAGNDGSGLAGMMPQNKTVADEVYASLQQGQAPQQEPTAMMAHGGLANLPSYNFMPHNYEHGGIVAFANRGAVEGGASTGWEGLEASGWEGLPPEPEKKIPFHKKEISTVPKVLKGIGQGFKAVYSPAGLAAGAIGTVPEIFETTTPEYEKRFGLEKSDNPLKQLLTRGAGAVSDVGNTMLGGQLSRFFPDVQETKAAKEKAAATPTVASPPPAPTPEAPADISKYFAATGSAGGAGAGAGGYRDNPALIKSRSDLIEAFKARVKEANPGKQEDLDASTKARYAKAGIGKAAEAEQARIAKREAGLGEESKAAFWRDLSKAGFSMAAFAGKRGREATGFLGALAAGGQDFSESNIKTAARFNELKESLADKQAALAQAQENVALGVLKESSAEFRDRSKAYETAKDKVLGYEASMVEEEIKAGRALEIARMQISAAAAGREDRNTAVKKLSDAYYAAIKAGDTPAQKEILKQIGLLNAASVAGVVSQGRTQSTEEIAEGKRADAFFKNSPLRMQYEMAKTPAERATALAALQASAKLAGVKLPDMAGGGASANRLTTGPDGMLTYNPQQPIE